MASFASALHSFNIASGEGVLMTKGSQTGWDAVVIPATQVTSCPCLYRWFAIDQPVAPELVFWTWRMSSMADRVAPSVSTTERR